MKIVPFLHPSTIQLTDTTSLPCFIDSVTKRLKNFQQPVSVHNQKGEVVFCAMEPEQYDAMVKQLEAAKKMLDSIPEIANRLNNELNDLEHSSRDLKRLLEKHSLI